IKMLNVNTCSITSVSNQENFCQTPLAEGLQTLLSPLILQTHYILNCNKSHFTIAAYIEGCPVENINIDNSTNPPTQKKFINYESKTFCFKDDFNLSEYFVDDILEANTLTGISLAIHTKGQIAFNDLTFDFSKLKVDNKEYNF